MQKYVNNPAIVPNDIPYINKYFYDVSAVFNPGATIFEGKTVLLLRVQGRSRETKLIKAISNDGFNFDINNKAIEIKGLPTDIDIYHIYDPRITKIDDIYYIFVAMDLQNECELGLIKTTNFEDYDFMGFTSKGGNRNGVLFSQKFNNNYYRLDRPNKSKLNNGVKTGSSIVLSKSKNLINWEEVDTVISGRPKYWDELIGAGPPPIKTKKGWLLVYHGVATHFASSNIYQAGVVLLDLDNPSKVISQGKQNIFEPRKLYELNGQVPNVVFPSGITVSAFDENGFALNNANVNIYYGAADTSVCIFETTVDELINACFE